MLVIGNGESRTSINIDNIHGIKVGCNAIWRDYFVDHLVCVDKRMVEEARGISNTKVYTREDWYQRYNVRTLPTLPYNGAERWDEPFQWGSGPYAVLLGAMLSNEIDMIGFDLHSKNNTVNNIYKDTPNYDSADKRPVDPSYWIHQIGMVFKYFPQTQFKIYQEPDWELPKAWTYPNVMVDTISNLSYNSI